MNLKLPLRLVGKKVVRFLWILEYTHSCLVTHQVLWQNWLFPFCSLVLSYAETAGVLMLFRWLGSLQLLADFDGGVVSVRIMKLPILADKRMTLFLLRIGHEYLFFLPLTSHLLTSGLHSCFEVFLTSFLTLFPATPPHLFHSSYIDHLAFLNIPNYSQLKIFGCIFLLTWKMGFPSLLYLFSNVISEQVHLSTSCAVWYTPCPSLLLSALLYFYSDYLSRSVICSSLFTSPCFYLCFESRDLEPKVLGI